MKQYFFLTIMAFASSAYGQTGPGKKLVEVTESSPVTISYSKTIDTNKVVGKSNYYINNVHYGNSMPVFNTVNLESVNVEKEGSKIFFALKDQYQPTFVTLDQLRKKYVDSKDAAIYMLDGNLIADPLQLIDENYVLHIHVQKTTNLPYLQARVKDLEIIYISTKSKANLERANTVMIRGNEGTGK